MNQTKNYSTFKLKEGNRVIDKRHVDAIKASILKYGYIQSCPIIVNKNFEVIDGQHRLQACREIGIPVTYMIEEEQKGNLLIDLNILQKKWTIGNYIKFYALEQDKEDYKRLYTLMHEMDLDPTSILSMALGKIVGGVVLANIKKGELTITPADAQRARVLYSNIKMLQDILGNVINGRLVRAIIHLENLPNFAWSILLDKAKKYKVKAYHCTNTQEWLEMLIGIYNYNNKKTHLEYMKG